MRKETKEIGEEFMPIAVQMSTELNKFMANKNKKRSASIIALQYGKKNTVLSLVAAELPQLCNMLASMLGSYVLSTGTSPDGALDLFVDNYRHKLTSAGEIEAIAMEAPYER